MIPHPIHETLFDEDTIHKRILELVGEMKDDLRDRDLIMIGILRGSFMFLADLCRELYREQIHPSIDFITLESYYGGTESSGEVRIAKDASVNVEGAHLLLIDDILDTGRTLDTAEKYFFNKGAEQIKTCVLLDKPERRVVPFEADYVGFTIENRFVIGYGLDYDSRFRELPYIAVVQEEN